MSESLKTENFSSKFWDETEMPNLLVKDIKADNRSRQKQSSSEKLFRVGTSDSIGSALHSFSNCSCPQFICSSRKNIPDLVLNHDLTFIESF